MVQKLLGIILVEVVFRIGKTNLAFEYLGIFVVLEPVLLHFPQRLVILHRVFQHKLITQNFRDHLLLQCGLSIAPSRCFWDRFEARTILNRLDV